MTQIYNVPSLNAYSQLYIKPVTPAKIDDPPDPKQSFISPSSAAVKKPSLLSDQLVSYLLMQPSDTSGSSASRTSELTMGSYNSNLQSQIKSTNEAYYIDKHPSQNQSNVNQLAEEIADTVILSNNVYARANLDNLENTSNQSSNTVEDDSSTDNTETNYAKIISMEDEEDLLTPSLIPPLTPPLTSSS